MAGNVARMEMKNEYKVLVRKPLGKHSFGILNGRWKDIVVDLREMYLKDWR
jgi:hypothetical protein